VRAGRSDTDLEQVEHTDGHGSTSVGALTWSGRDASGGRVQQKITQTGGRVRVVVRRVVVVGTVVGGGDGAVDGGPVGGGSDGSVATESVVAVAVVEVAAVVVVAVPVAGAPALAVVVTTTEDDVGPVVVPGPPFTGNGNVFSVLPIMPSEPVATPSRHRAAVAAPRIAPNANRPCPPSSASTPCIYRTGHPRSSGWR
jgi:hypothetical protein